MSAGSDDHRHPEAEHRAQALAAAGIVGTWERDHRGDTFRLCRGAAELLAGDADLAWQDLPPRRALANVYGDDIEWLNAQMQRAAGAAGLYVREYRVRDDAHGVRRVLTRGRTYLAADGRPSHTLGVIIDITGIEADGLRRFGSGQGVTGQDALDSAAEHGVAAYEAIRASGIPGLLAPARALLMALGREIARRLPRRPGPLQ